MKFEDLKFREKTAVTFLNGTSTGGFSSITKINGYTLSVQCGSFNYCTPRFNLPSVEDYSAFEIAVANNREFVTRNFINEDSPDDVAGWVTREEINEVINKIKEK